MRSSRPPPIIGLLLPLKMEHNSVVARETQVINFLYATTRAAKYGHSCMLPMLLLADQSRQTAVNQWRLEFGVVSNLLAMVVGWRQSPS